MFFCLDLGQVEQIFMYLYLQGRNCCTSRFGLEGSCSYPGRSFGSSQSVLNLLPLGRVIIISTLILLDPRSPVVVSIGIELRSSYHVLERRHKSRSLRIHPVNPSFKGLLVGVAWK